MKKIKLISIAVIFGILFSLFSGCTTDNAWIVKDDSDSIVTESSSSNSTVDSTVPSLSTTSTSVSQLSTVSSASIKSTSSTVKSMSKSTAKTTNATAKTTDIIITDEAKKAYELFFDVITPIKGKNYLLVSEGETYVNGNLISDISSRVYFITYDDKAYAERFINGTEKVKWFFENGVLYEKRASFNESFSEDTPIIQKKSTYDAFLKEADVKEIPYKNMVRLEGIRKITEDPISKYTPHIDKDITISMDENIMFNTVRDYLNELTNESVILHQIINYRVGISASTSKLSATVTFNIGVDCTIGKKRQNFEHRVICAIYRENTNDISINGLL